MFKKPYRVKTNTQVKASDKKKIRLEIGSHFPLLTEDDLASLIPNKETISIMKIATHCGENVIVYLADKTPVTFVINKVMYPTVYMLWRFPSLVHTFTTHSVVFSKLVGGADLMLPGVVVEEPFTIKSFGKLKKGDIVAVNLTTNFAPVAVGTAALSSFDMYMSAKRGKGVHVIHCYGDQLCANVKQTPPNIPHPSAIGIDEGDEEMEESNSINTNKSEKSCEKNGCPNAPDAEELADPKLQDDDVSEKDTDDMSVVHESLQFCKLELDNDPVDRVEEELDFDTEGANSNSDSENESAESMKEIIEDASEIQESMSVGGEIDSAQESSKIDNSDNISEDTSALTDQQFMDKLLEYSFLKALKHAARKLTLPVLTSNFYKLHIIPSCPRGATLDLKKSSYKKLSKFLKEMEAKGVIEVKELSKGVESITNINFNNPTVKLFVEDSDDEEECSGAAGTKKPAEINEMYVINATTLPLFKIFGYRKGDSLLGTMIRHHLTDYVAKHSLQSASDKRFVKLDHLLSSCLRVKEDEMTWKELFSTCIEQMGNSFSVGQTGQVTKGKLKPIEIVVATRTGNKKVTLINNLESYGINCSEFAKKCQHGVAASATVTQSPGIKSAQVMVQGNQVIFLEKILTGEYQIHKRFLRGLENAPKPKKAKKSTK